MLQVRWQCRSALGPQRCLRHAPSRVWPMTLLLLLRGLETAQEALAAFQQAHAAFQPWGAAPAAGSGQPAPGISSPGGGAEGERAGGGEGGGAAAAQAPAAAPPPQQPAAIGGVTLLEVSTALAALHTDMGSRAKAAGEARTPHPAAVQHSSLQSRQHAQHASAAWTHRVCHSTPHWWWCCGGAAGLVNETLAHYQRALEVCPTYAPTYYHMGVLYSEGKQVRPAARHCPRSRAPARVCRLCCVCKSGGTMQAHWRLARREWVGVPRRARGTAPCARSLKWRWVGTSRRFACAPRTPRRTATSASSSR